MTEEPKKRTGAVKKEKSDKKPNKQRNAVMRYFRQTKGELDKVTWPSREESWRLTGVVLGVTIVMAAFLWVCDTLFSNGIQTLIQQLAI